jgi:transcriptional regulator GlxA family with amidase domain
VARQLSERYPAIDVDAERVRAKSGSIYTSAGVTAAIDLTMGLVEEDAEAHRTADCSNDGGFSEAAQWATAV